MCDRTRINRPWGRVLPLLLMWAAASLEASGVRAQDRQPASPARNVLFLVCDDLNCDLGAYGHPQVQSPHIDQLAREAVRFERAYCQYPLCGPSRASFMTGLYPDQTLVRRNAVYIRQHVPNVKTMAQLFRDHGYLATRVGKIFHYNVPAHIGTSGHDDPDSWDFTFNPRGRDVAEEHKIFSLTPGSFGGTLSWLAADGGDLEQTDGLAATQAVELLRSYAASGQPFFLAVGLYRPHTPYVAPRKYFDLYPLDSIRVPTVPPGYLDSLPRPARMSLTRKKDQVQLKDELARQAIQAYYASITFADAQVGRILAAVRETGLAENTVVVFTSDHGYHMGEHGHYQKTTLFENATRVPLIIRAPGVTRAGSVAGMAEMTDFYPTLAALCGLAPPPFLAGVNLTEALSDPTVAVRQSALSQYNNGYSLRTERFRYTSWGEAGDQGEELYDHHADPEELVNLAGQSQWVDQQQQLRELLAERVAAARRPPAGVRQIGDDPSATRSRR